MHQIQIIFPIDNFTNDIRNIIANIPYHKKNGGNKWHLAAIRQTDKFLSKHNYDVINDDNHASIFCPGI